MAYGPVVLAGPDELELSRWISAGDGLVIGEACAEPTVLVDALVQEAPALGVLSAFVGLSWRERLTEANPQALRLLSYGALGKLARAPELTIVPCHFSALPALLADGALPCDVAMVQVSPPDGRGRCSFGAGAEYFADAASHARVVIAEVNDHCPVSAGAYLEWDRIDVAVMTSRPLLEAPAVSPGEVERRIAANVAELIRDGDTIQLGVGAIPEAVMEALGSHRRLGVHSGMITEGVLRLIDAGVITGEDKPSDERLCVAGAALGSRQLFDALADRDEIRILTTSYTHAPATLARVGRLCAINSALQVDLDGQANSESIDGRPLGAIGGQVDFLRAAAASGGAAILALPAERIVERLSGPVSVGRADVDWVVTEHGARSLRGLSGERRRQALEHIAEEAVAV
jgi:acyl-CoA hydrolase